MAPPSNKLPDHTGVTVFDACIESADFGLFPAFSKSDGRLYSESMLKVKLLNMATDETWTFNCEDVTYESMMELMKSVGVCKWSQLPHTRCRVIWNRRDHIRGIGHKTENRWFNAETLKSEERDSEVLWIHKGSMTLEALNDLCVAGLRDHACDFTFDTLLPEKLLEILHIDSRNLPTNLIYRQVHHTVAFSNIPIERGDILIIFPVKSCAELFGRAVR